MRIGRLFVERPAQEYRLLFERVGFRLVFEDSSEDGFGLDVSWTTLVFQRAPATRSVDQIETIIHRDQKFATYKLALLRALCEIVQLEHFRVARQEDGRVAVPLVLVTEKWLTYYWPLIEADFGPGDRIPGELGIAANAVVFPQMGGGERNRPMAFRRPLLDLIRRYPANGLAIFLHDHRDGQVPAHVHGAADTAISAIFNTIIVGPVRHAGGAIEEAEAFFGKRG